ncbi:hypothetical protein DM02DRAFT_608480 [Periconia macrospinosa]|uniref:Uncharacterized protein n=1 Tax=Periconia macrospinosa TaxID=97972 RepID=A0A2V1EBF3_9PLEO|nr:hypothetical protein DM02DRAFT_608480 [Periconia macrospinosa]
MLRQRRCYLGYEQNDAKNAWRKAERIGGITFGYKLSAAETCTNRQSCRGKMVGERDGGEWSVYVGWPRWTGKWYMGWRGEPWLGRL